MYYVYAGFGTFIQKVNAFTFTFIELKIECIRIQHSIFQKE